MEHPAHKQHRDYEQDYPDYTQSPDWEHGDEVPSNKSANPTFYDIVEQAQASRRGFMIGGLAAAVSGVFSVGLSTREALASSTSTESLLGFAAVPVDATDRVVVPEGYKVQVLGAWGEPILGDMPAFDIANTGDEQARQIGQHHDGMHFFPIDGSSEDGLLVVNHEYVETRFMFPEYAGQEVNTWEVLVDGDGTRPADHVLKEMNAHGVSVYRTRKGADGWEIVADPLNRRVTALTPMEIAGPVRGSAHVVTKYSPDGTKTRGTINNCAHGVTPWNTYLETRKNLAISWVS